MELKKVSQRISP